MVCEWGSDFLRRAPVFWAHLALPSARPSVLNNLCHCWVFCISTMKRAREQSTKAVEGGRSPVSVPAPAPRAVSLRPPPPIQPFSDDSEEDDGAHGGSSSSSSSSAGSVEGSEPKRAKKEQTEVEGWRRRAMAIIDGEKTAGGAGAEETGNSRRKFAVVCSSNVNRSIMAEILLKKHNMRARSFGTGRCAFPVIFLCELHRSLKKRVMMTVPSDKIRHVKITPAHPRGKPKPFVFISRSRDHTRIGCRGRATSVSPARSCRTAVR